MYVYVMENQHAPGLVKIGRSVDPERRRDELAKGTGVPGRSMHIVASRPTGNDTVAVEHAMHQIFANVREGQSEWFRVHPDDAVDALDEAIEAIATHQSFITQEENDTMDYDTTTEWMTIPGSTVPPAAAEAFIPAQADRASTAGLTRPESFSPGMARHIDEIKLEAARVGVAQLVARCASYLGSAIVRINEDMDAIQGKELDDCNEQDIADRIAYLSYNYGIPAGFTPVAPKGLLDADERRVLMLMDRAQLATSLQEIHGSAAPEEWVRAVALDMAEYRMALMEIKLGLTVDTDHSVPDFAAMPGGSVVSAVVLDAVFGMRVGLACSALGLSMAQVAAQFHDGRALRPLPEVAKPTEVKRMGVWGRRK